ncbi:Brefeldin A-inhibited guanine nucleotide-exchange protein 1 [Amphibalanus amphitrite]|uniref:Brefeldin A-inhibited guanine nucleotide-exchange protein 1 n=1 Tax=Amphibalanus amphitrite TaxID=1232801 RepID=A0A6A4W4Q7_AMPAM|nr:Brefeldin A-inhibited guanine nucleotide-exchange protein 1 [Amphibalanus amphitrite]
MVVLRYSTVQSHTCSTQVFFNDIILTLLETPSSSFEHKWLVVQALTHVCADAQSVVDIYVNYDCHFASANVFERLVVDLSRLAQGRQFNSINCESPCRQVGLTAAQERSIRLRALECLVGLLKCMVEWSREFSTGIQSPACSGLDSERDWSEEPAPATPGTLSTRGSELSLSDHTPEAYESLKQIKDIWEQGIDMFNRKPKRGLAFLQRQGLLKDTPDSIAAFFHEDHRLDRTVLGDFLGEPDQQQVMEAYVDRLDFVGCEFLAALRQFLDGFRLPGEAQKIDRLMEKFASKYCECNPDQELFTSPDTAYVLAFSIIMLTTDLHSAHVKHKITMEQYIRMNRGINGGEDLPTLYLTRIYDDIAGNAIKMRVIPCARPGRQVAQNEKQRRLLFNLEMEQMSMAARSLMEAASHVQAEFTCATHVEHVRPMFQLAWAPVLAAFSTGLQDGEGAEVDDLCLDGVRCAIHIACVFQMQVRAPCVFQMQMERDAYLQTLARFALASASAGDAELKAKDMDTVKMLILLALRDGNFLSRPWPEMLRCIAQMEEAHLSGAGWPAQHDGGLARETGELTQRNAGTPNGGCRERASDWVKRRGRGRTGWISHE